VLFWDFCCTSAAVQWSPNDEFPVWRSAASVLMDLQSTGSGTASTEVSSAPLRRPSPPSLMDTDIKVKEVSITIVLSFPSEFFSFLQSQCESCMIPRPGAGFDGAAVERECRCSRAI
jgi:hypothetical protein